jgi:hypothetical protein
LFHALFLCLIYVSSLRLALAQAAQVFARVLHARVRSPSSLKLADLVSLSTGCDSRNLIQPTQELRNLFESGITARAIFEQLQSCVSDADAIEVAKILRDRDFDVAGVQQYPKGPVIGFVSRESLRNGMVKNHLEQMTAEHLISDSTSLASLLSIFKTRERVFVLVGEQVMGIITRADINKPPVRAYLFGLISLLEMHFTYWVRKAYPNDEWKGEISDDRLKAPKRSCFCSASHETSRQILLIAYSSTTNEILSSLRRRSVTTCV